MTSNRLRAIHLIDIENLSGSSRPSLTTAMRTRRAYEAAVPIGGKDLVVVASAHCNGLAAGCAWPGPRLLWRSGPDGADLALIDVLAEEVFDHRFGQVLLGSGDGIFAPHLARLAAAGLMVVNVVRPGTQAAACRLAAHRTVFLSLSNPKIDAA